MAQPTPYVPSFDFSDFSTLNPDTPQPGVSLDAQFNALKLTTDEVLDNLALIQRDDGLLANGIVTPDSLSEEIYAGISRAIPWVTATEYEAGDLVWYLSVLYSANSDFTSTTNPSVDTTRYTLILDMTATVPDIITQEAQDAADAAAASAVTAAASAASITSIVGGVSYLWAGTATGAANTIVLAPEPSMTSYAVGHKLRFLVGTTNTGAVVMNTDNALGSTSIKKSIGDALVALAPGDLKAGTIAEIEYISALVGYQLLNPPTYSQGTDVASATTVNLDTTNGDYVTITGTTGITGITLAQGRERTVTFSGILTLTHSAGLLLKNNGSNITTAAGDSAVFRGEASGVVRCVSYIRASGIALNTVAVPLTFQYLTAGSGATYTTPANVKAILVQMIGGGGGGGATATNAGAAGGATIFNSVQAAGGGGGNISSASGNSVGAGGTGGSGSASLRKAGCSGFGGYVLPTGGAPSPFGGGGGGGNTTGVGTAAPANTGAGGGGASSNGAVQYAATSGGAGEYVEIYISAPAATYTYTIGAGGNGGAAGTLAGGNGGTGFIKVTEYY